MWTATEWGNAPRRRRIQWGKGSENSQPTPPLPGNGLAANTQSLQNCLIALGVRVTQVRQKPATLGNQGQQTFAGTMVFFVRLEVLRKHRNAAA